MFKKLTFTYRVHMNPAKNETVEIVNDNWILSVNGEKLSPERSREVREAIEELCLNTWQEIYWPEGFSVLDGYSWRVILEETKPKNTIERGGLNAYPWCFYQLIKGYHRCCAGNKGFIMEIRKSGKVFLLKKKQQEEDFESPEDYILQNPK